MAVYEHEAVEIARPTTFRKNAKLKMQIKIIIAKQIQG